MAKRPKFSRWRRNPGTFRFGEQRPPDPDEELQRLSLYIPGSIFDLAEAQAVRLGYKSSQEYCTDIVLQAVKSEQVEARVAIAETKLGPFEGLHEISDDPAYLADLRQAGNPRIQQSSGQPSFLAEPETGIVWTESPSEPDVEGALESVRNSSGLAAPSAPALSASARVVLRHAAQGDYDPSAFLPSLRRGEPVPPAEVAELAQALHTLEIEYRSIRSMDRRLAFSLHRLAYESQILQTDAFPGVFDLWTVEMVRAVQETVERILSGQDIRYQSPMTLETIAPPPTYPWELPH